MTARKITRIDSKIILNPAQCPDPWFYTHCALNPYRGCAFSCKYCDGKANWYGLPDFGTHIRVKNDVVSQLRKQLMKLGFESSRTGKQTSLGQFLNITVERPEQRRKIVLGVGGGVTDVYQPIEKTERITRKIIKLLIEFEVPAFFLTKSTLIERDLDLIGELHDRTYACVNFSVTLADESLKRLFEPYSPPTHKRFDVLGKFREAGVRGGISMMPLLPFIGDTDENLTALLKMAQEVKADHTLISGLTLKAGNREEFLPIIAKHFPDYLEFYKKIFPPNNTYGHPHPIPGMRNVMMAGHVLSKQFGIYPRIHKPIIEGYKPNNLKVVEHLHYVLYLKQWLLRKMSIREQNNWYKNCCQVELMDEDVSSLSQEERREKIGGMPAFHTIVDEFLERGDSKVREVLEEEISHQT